MSLHCGHVHIGVPEGVASVLIDIRGEEEINYAVVSFASCPIERVPPFGVTSIEIRTCTDELPRDSKMTSLERKRQSMIGKHIRNSRSWTLKSIHTHSITRRRKGREKRRFVCCEC